MADTTKPTSVDETLVGSSYPPAVFRAGAEHIAAFAESVGATNPLHVDREAARAAGYPDVVAPPTFAVVPAQRAEAAYIEDPRSGIDFSRVVHGEERFLHHRPIVAGDELTATAHVEAVTHRGALSLVTTRAEIIDSAGEPVATVYSQLVVRGES